MSVKGVRDGRERVGTGLPVYVSHSGRHGSGEFAAAQRAAAKASEFMGEYLSSSAYAPRMAVAALDGSNTAFGDDPIIVATQGAMKLESGAWEYAKRRYQ